MSGKVTGWVVRNGPEDRALFGVLVVLADAARNDGTGISVSVREVARRARMSRSAAGRYLAQLLDEGWIERTMIGWSTLPSAYRIVLPQGVDERGTRPTQTGRMRPTQAGRTRPTQAGRTRPTQGGTRTTTTGKTGFTGNGSRPSGGPPRGRRPQVDEQAVIDACGLCDDHGWVGEGNRAARCDHAASNGARRR